MRTVHKFPFAIDDVFTLHMPFGARVLFVDMQNGTPCMWAEVCTANSCTPKKFRLSGTGHPVNDEWKHVASFQMPPFVWHLWEEAA